MCLFVSFVCLLSSGPPCPTVGKGSEGEREAEGGRERGSRGVLQEIGREGGMKNRAEKTKRIWRKRERRRNKVSSRGRGNRGEGKREIWIKKRSRRFQEETGV